MNTAYRTPLNLYGWDSATGTLVLRSRAYIGDNVSLMISSDGVIVNITLTTGINWVD